MQARFRKIVELIQDLRCAGELHIHPGIAFDVSGSRNYRPNISGDTITLEGLRSRARDHIAPERGHGFRADRSGKAFGNAGRNTARASNFEQPDLGLPAQRDQPLGANGDRSSGGCGP